MDDVLKILVVDDDAGDRRQMIRAMKQAGLAFEVVETTNTADAMAACDKQEFDCSIIDYRMPGQDGLKVISSLTSRYPFMALVMATGEGDESIAATAMKRGALDYIAKGNINPSSIKRTIRGAVQKARLQRKVAEQQQQLQRQASQLTDEVKALAVQALQAKTDQLTGLPGRALFIDAVTALRAQSARKNLATAMLFIDLDEFKSINDRFGHDRGDDVLVRTAQVIRSSVRGRDVAGRFGGDEFVVCLSAPAQSIEEIATRVAERILLNVARIGDGIGCSIGIAFSGASAGSPEIAIREADAAMYESKKCGKNRFAIYGRSSTGTEPSCDAGDCVQWKR
ncbi:MAG TPA: diguanylate cyclase [Pseudolabrys sp.]|nr:diguanylate cyclase [Pseudolabrys sp.]